MLRSAAELLRSGDINAAQAVTLAGKHHVVSLGRRRWTMRDAQLRGVVSPRVMRWDIVLDKCNAGSAKCIML